VTRRPPAEQLAGVLEHLVRTADEGGETGSFSGWSAEAVDRDLLERAAHVAGLVEFEDERGGRLELERDAAALQDPAHPWRVGFEGAVLAATGDLPWPTLQAGAEPVVVTVVDGGGRAWRVTSAAFEAGERGGSPVVVQVAGPTAPFAAVEAPFRRGLLFSLLGALVLGGLGAALLAHRSLAPLQRLADDIAGTGIGSLDSTVGIPESERSKVLERFYRGTSGTASRQPGSGLGLSVVKAIAEAHGAGVRLDGRPEGGLEVTVELRVTGAQDAAAAPAGGGHCTS
jgi:hypothetical protein